METCSSGGSENEKNGQANDFKGNNHTYNLRKRQRLSYNPNDKQPMSSIGKKRASIAGSSISTVEYKSLRNGYKQKQMAVKKSIPYKSEFHINQLSDCVLSMIFKCLQPTDRIVLERVCRRWNYVARNFSWDDINLLSFEDVDKSVFALYPNISTGEVIMHSTSRPNRVIVQAHLIVKRAGKYLTALDFAHMTFLNYKFCQLLSFTPNILHLNLSGIFLTNSSIATVGRHLPNLKCAIFRRCFGDTQVERGLSRLFSSCKQLQVLDISYNESFAAVKCFADLPKSLLELGVSHCERLSKQALAGIRENCLNLVSLKLDCISGAAIEFDKLFARLPNLESLQFGEILDTAMTERDVVSIGKLSKLRHLFINENHIVTDAMLQAIGKGCLNLEKFDMTGADRLLTEDSLRPLANLTRLTTVNFSEVGKMTDDMLKSIAQHGQLREVLLHRCYKISDDSIIFMLKECKKLRLLDISYCSKVTNACLPVLKEHLSAMHGGRRPSCLKTSADKDSGKFLLWTRNSGVYVMSADLMYSPWLKLMNDGDYDHLTLAHIFPTQNVYEDVLPPFFH